MKFVGSVRFFILLACVFTLLPLLLLGIREYSERKTLDENLTRERVEQQRGFIREAFESRVKEPIRAELAHLIDNPILDALMLASKDERLIAVADLERLFRRVNASNKSIDSLWFVNRSGVEESAVIGGRRSVVFRDFNVENLPTENADERRIREHTRVLLQELRRRPDRTLLVDPPFHASNGESLILAGISRTDPDIGAFGAAIFLLYRIDAFVNEMAHLEFESVPVVWLLLPGGQAFLEPPPGQKRLDPRPLITQAIADKLVLREEGAVLGAELAVDNESTELTAAVSVPGSVYNKSRLETRNRLSVWAVVSILLSILLGVVVSNIFISRPIVQLSQATKEVASGNLSRDVRLSTAGPTTPVEIRELAKNFSELVDRLRQLPRTLEQSTTLLTGALANLNEASREQAEIINRQAAALHEAQVTVEEIRQTSAMASQKAQTVLDLVERADEVGRTGEIAIEESLGALSSIRSQVGEIAERITALGERTRQIGIITETVKDLADQSDVLALNAAIEAVRSGEHGRAFGVVAREIRSLADQSIQATNRVRSILDTVGTAIDKAVKITEKGSRGIEDGATRMTVSGGKIRELSSIVKDNASAVRQIAAAVSQQNAGISQMVTTVNDLNSMMTTTVKRLNATMENIQRLSEVADQVSEVVRGFRVD